MVAREVHVADFQLWVKCIVITPLVDTGISCFHCHMLPAALWYRYKLGIFLHYFTQ